MQAALTSGLGFWHAGKGSNGSSTDGFCVGPSLLPTLVRMGLLPSSSLKRVLGSGRSAGLVGT